MAEKWQTISELAETTSRQVTQSPEQWRRFLTTAGRFYKAYDFDDQLLIYAQKPDATACADMPTWNNKMRRWVNGGSTAIALVRKGYGGKPYLDYVHDVADTHPVRGGKDPWLWSMDDDSRMPVMERLREVFGAEGGNDLGDLLMDAAAKSVEDTYGDYLTDLIYEKEDSFLEELDDLNIEVTFRDTLRASVQYAVLTRCGLDASRYLDEEDLRGITNFNTIATLACLGTATAQVNRTILLEIGDTIRNIEREKVKKPLAKQEAVAYNDGRNFNTLKRERGDKDGIDIQQTERLSGAEPENGRNGRESADPGPVRESQREISDGTQERAVQYDGAQRQTMEAPDGDRQGGAGTGGRADGGDGKEPGRERSPESGQSNGLGAENEQHQAGGGGSRAERPDLQLKKQEETAGVKPAVSSSAELEEPFSTQPAYRQMTLFDLPEVQIEKIAQKEAEAAAPASSRSRQKKKEQPQGNPLEAARRNLFAESGKEDNQLSLDLAAMTGRESASGPDIQEAEHNLKSANADIGAARANFFPTISLTASAGVGSDALSSLFSHGMQIWSFAPSVTLPLFTGGSNLAQLRYAEAQKRGLIATYEKTVQSAFKDVANALARRTTLEEQLDAQRQYVKAEQQTVDVGLRRYQAGVGDYLTVLTAQRSLWSAQQELLALQLTDFTNRITLWQSLGGGMSSLK